MNRPFLTVDLAIESLSEGRLVQGLHSTFGGVEVDRLFQKLLQLGLKHKKDYFTCPDINGNHKTNWIGTSSF